MQPSTELVERVGRAMGSRPHGWERLAGRGATPNQRWLVRSARGARLFVKASVDRRTAEWLRAEYRVYSQLRAPFLPALRGWDDDGARPVLLLDDLSEEFWPPPWSNATIDAVLGALDELATTPPPAGLPRLEDTWREASGAGWDAVAADPELFLNLGLCSRAWLETALPVLQIAAGDAVLTGESLVHFDVRSDNVCLTKGRAVLVDWNWASIGNPVMEVAAWLPSLHAEGGPPPEAILRDGAAELAALLAGYWAANAGLSPIPRAPAVRPLQLAQLRVALPWAARCLDLPPPA